MRRMCHPHAAPKACGAAEKGAALRSATPTDTTTTERPSTDHGLGLARLPGKPPRAHIALAWNTTAA
jgi:hypothetical protein